MRSIIKSVRFHLPIKADDDLARFQKVKFLPLIFALVLSGCATQEGIRKVEKLKIKQITLTDNTIREVAVILQKCIYESGGSIDVVVEKQKESDSVPFRKMICLDRISLDESNVGLEVLCELISFRSHTFYRISPDKITFYEPKIPAPNGNDPCIVFGVKGDKPSYFFVSLQESTPYNPGHLYLNRKKWNFSAEFRETSKGTFIVFTNRSPVAIPISLTEWLTPNKWVNKEINVKGLSSVSVPWRDYDKDDKDASFTFSIYDEGAFKWFPEIGGRRLK